jgi:poly(beta-D-mannuronate) lyase
MQLKTKIKYTAALVAGVLSMTAIPIVNAASLSIVNAGFEDSFDSGWTDTDPSAISSDERSGSKAAKITGDGGKFEQDITVTANTNYELSAYIEGIGKIGATVDGTRYTRTGGSDDEYEKVTVSFNSGSATSITIFGNYYGGEGRFDDFALESTGTATVDEEVDTDTEEPVASTGSCSIDMSIWGYTAGDGVSMNDVDDIQDLVDNKTLGANGAEEITWDAGCPTFTVANDAASSGGSTYPRSELRELMARYTDGGEANVSGLTKNNWVTSEASSSNQTKVGGVDGNLKATLVVNTVSVDATSDDQIGRIIVGQIHGEDHEPVKIYYRKLPGHTKGSVFFTVDDSSGDPGDRINVIGFTDKNDTDEDASGDPVEPENGIALGDEWSYEIDLKGDQLKVTVWHDGYTYTTADSIAYTKTRSKQLIRVSTDTDAITISDFFADDYMYFKAGLYNQNKTGTSSPDYASVTFKVIDVSH